MKIKTSDIEYIKFSLVYIFLLKNQVWFGIFYCVCLFIDNNVELIKIKF